MSLAKSNLSLRGRIIGAGSWVLGGYVISLALRLGGNLVMTRLLVPEMFGVMAVANIFYLGIALFSDLGLQQNIIQSNRGDDPLFLNTVWTVQIIRGGLIWLLAIGLATTLQLMNTAQTWPADSVYAEPILPFVIGVITFNAVISGFNSTKLATANRNISLGLITKIELSSQLVALILMVTWALMDRSIWALVAGSLLNSIVKMVLSHTVMPGFKNKLYWDPNSFREVFTFGKWIFLSSIMGFLAANGDTFLLGGLVDSRVLGLYAIALLMIQSIRLVIQKITSSVAFPALSEVARERPVELKQVYYKFRKPLDVFLLFTAGFLFMSGHLLIEILYDDRYLEAGHMLEILSVAFLFERYNLAGDCFMALGKPKLLSPVIGIRLIVLFSLLPLMNALYGLQGALWVVATSSLFGLPLVFYFKQKLGLLHGIREIQVLPALFMGGLFGYLLETLFVWVGWTG